MERQMLLSPGRELTEEEKQLVWRKPQSHIESEAERRICAEVRRNWHNDEMKITNILLEGDAGSGKTQLAKALSADFGLPYTKITCFADMDKSDILGSILPVLPESGGHTKSENHIEVRERAEAVRYQYYPSEIVRAYENGWLLEIQEPTVIRDAAVLMALNSALEPDGSINLPTRVVHRHPDFIAVITANRGYNGCRPLNEALRDRIQHTEKMDLPPKAVMMERAAVKTGCTDDRILSPLADVITVLDETAKANAIKGVAGMRSYLYWVDAVAAGAQVRESMYHKVIYKITTDPYEISILEQALAAAGLSDIEQQKLNEPTDLPAEQNPEVMELNISADGQYSGSEEDTPPDPAAIRLRRSKDSTGHSDRSAQDAAGSSPEITRRSDRDGGTGAPRYHEMAEETQPKQAEPTEPTERQRDEFRKELNQEARASVKGSMHQQIRLIVHRPAVTGQNRIEYREQAAELMPVIREMIHRTKPLLEYETASETETGRLYGTEFCADRVAAQDFRYFSRRLPPEDDPSLAVALRIDESASMASFGRIEAARKAAIALDELCSGCGIPVMIYGDTADRSRMEQMSLYSYVDFESRDPDEKYALAGIQGRSDNRDGMALRIIADRLLKAPQKTKLLISISDGQPKAMPDYTGKLAAADMKKTLQEYRHKGISFLAASIGQDREIISDIYGKENTLDITDLKELPVQLVRVIGGYL